MSEDQKPTPKERAAAFVDALRGISKDRGKLAALRRGLADNPRLRVDAWPIIFQLGGSINHLAYISVAALYASHPQDADMRNFGETCRMVAQGNSKDIAESFEKRFRRLLACNSTHDVVTQILFWIRLAAKGKRTVGVNYESLFADLWNWSWYADEIRIKWAKSFWLSGESVNSEDATTNDVLP